MDIIKEDYNNCNLYCKDCKKSFKTIGTLSNHLNSKQHLKNKNRPLPKCSIGFNHIHKSDYSSKVEQQSYTNIDIHSEINPTKFNESLSNMLERESMKNKKNLRIHRMNQKSKAEKFVLNELEDFSLINSEPHIPIGYKISKINRSKDRIQKNILTSSRSSFIKSTLKP